jgi:hypothetical protein
MPKHSSHILELAERGAQERYQELKAEIAELTKAFPRLEFGSAISPSVPRQKYTVTPKRRKLSAVARRKISLAQKRRWAKQRARKPS